MPSLDLPTFDAVSFGLGLLGGLLLALVIDRLAIPVAERVSLILALRSRRRGP